MFIVSLISPCNDNFPVILITCLIYSINLTFLGNIQIDPKTVFKKLIYLHKKFMSVSLYIFVNYSPH